MRHVHSGKNTLNTRGYKPKPRVAETSRIPPPTVDGRALRNLDLAAATQQPQPLAWSATLADGVLASAVLPHRPLARLTV